MEKIGIPSNSKFTGDRYQQHPGGKRNGESCLWIHIGRIPEDGLLMDAGAFDFENSLSIARKDNSQSQTQIVMQQN